MAEKHLDRNGKKIQIGDIVLVHKYDSFCDKSCKVCNKLKKLEADIAIVTGFGCITVETPVDGLIMVINDETNVEVIGDIRDDKRVSKL